MEVPFIRHLLLFSFMESLGTMISFFSQKVEEKVVLIRALSAKAHGRRSPTGHSGLENGVKTRRFTKPRRDLFQLADLLLLSFEAYHSVRSMVEAELTAGVVDFSRHTDSGCRTLLRLHRSLLWLKLMLEGLAEGRDADGRYRTPGELSR